MAFIQLRNDTEQFREDIVRISFQFLRDAGAHRGIFALGRRNEQNIAHFSVQPDRLHGKAFPFYGTGGQHFCIYFSAGIQRNLLRQDNLTGQIALCQQFIQNEHLNQCPVQVCQSRRSGFIHLDVENRNIVMKRLVELRDNPACGHAGLSRNGILHKTCVKADTGIVDKELIGPSNTRQAPVFIHPHEIIGIEIVLFINPLQFKKHRVIQTAAAHGRRVQEQHTGTRTLFNVVIPVFLFHIDFCLKPRHQESDGIILPRGRSQRAGTSHFGEPVSVDNPCRGTA